MGVDVESGKTTHQLIRYSYQIHLFERAENRKDTTLVSRIVTMWVPEYEKNN